ncbi:MAG: NAD(+)/NADH kinase [Candidatus Promineifilaceae bacterium]
MSAIGILYSAKVADGARLAADVQTWLRDRGREAWLEPTSRPEEARAHLGRSSLLIVLGGDGTTLLAARLAAGCEAPILSINLGRVGFLSEADPANWPQVLERVLAGDHWIERRLMLDGRVVRAGGDLGRLTALNDIVVSRGIQVRMVRFHLYVDGDHVTTYSADALIVATPTGSTAYSMAAGGPLLPPQLQNFLVLPVAPHLSFERPLVLHQQAEVKIRLEMEQAAVVSADGQDTVELESGDEVIIGRHAQDSLFVRVSEPSYFYLRLMQKLSFWSLKQ